MVALKGNIASPAPLQGPPCPKPGTVEPRCPLSRAGKASSSSVGTNHRVRPPSLYLIFHEALFVRPASTLYRKEASSVPAARSREPATWKALCLCGRTVSGAWRSSWQPEAASPCGRHRLVGRTPGTGLVGRQGLGTSATWAPSLQTGAGQERTRRTGAKQGRTRWSCSRSFSPQTLIVAPPHLAHHPCIGPWRPWLGVGGPMGAQNALQCFLAAQVEPRSAWTGRYQRARGTYPSGGAIPGAHSWRCQ